jgi:PelA/Pel-15E family pectate lyase
MQPGLKMVRPFSRTPVRTDRLSLPDLGLRLVSGMRTVKSPGFTVWLALALACRLSLPAAIIGTNPPALAVTAERIARLPASEQPAWTRYLRRTERQRLTDHRFLRSELKEHGLQETVAPPQGRSGSRLPLRNQSAWYAQAEARRIADIVVSFQTPAGGWSKNLDMTQHRRAPGELFAGESIPIRMGSLDNDRPQELEWNFVGTFDNDATTTQLRYLAKVIAATDPGRNEAYRRAFQRGLDYIFAAQYPNGGWPQVWPLQGGYHDAITFNDGAMINVLDLLKDVAAGTNDFCWVPKQARKAAAASFQRGLDCILASQVVTNGCRTVWCQQCDALSLQPTSARNYEMPAQSGSESAEVMSFLMRLRTPDSRTVAAVHAAAAWFEKTSLRGIAFQRVGSDDRQLIYTPGAGPFWARYYMLGSDRPLFGDRDKTIHDDVMEISKERRKGYRWFCDQPSRALQEYARWRETHPLAAAHGQ